MFKVTFETGEMVLEQDSLPTDDDCLYMLDTGEVDIVIAGSGEAANTNHEERKVRCYKAWSQIQCLACVYRIHVYPCTHGIGYQHVIFILLQ